MTERDNPKEKTTLALLAELRSFAKEHNPGTLGFLALSDFITNQEALWDLYEKRKALAEYQGDINSHSKIAYESDLRIAEIVFGNVQTEILKRTNTLPGYDDAYSSYVRLNDELSYAFGRDHGLSSKEAQQRSYREIQTLITEKLQSSPQT